MISSSANMRALVTPRWFRSSSTKATASSSDSNCLYPGLPSGVWKITMCDTKRSSWDC